MTDQLAVTDAGSAFEGFFQLLCDQNRSTEFKDQLRSILNRPVSEQLTQQQHQFLSRLMRELSHESERVFHIRRRTEESLRAYIESGAALENRAVDKLLHQLERLAVDLKEAGTVPNTSTSLSLPVGPIQISSPATMRLRMPDEKLNTSGVEQQTNSRIPNALMLDCLDTVKIKEIAMQTRDILRKHGPMTIASIVSRHPLKSGLEELVAYLRVARSVGATTLEAKENVEFLDKHGVRLKASIPKLLLTADLFPDNIEEMTI